MTILISLVIAVLPAQTALAARRENKPFNKVNGRAAAAPTAPRVFIVSAPGGGAAPNIPPAQAPDEEAPPHFSKPGALIRTTGQLPLYERSGSRAHTVDAGEITLNRRKAVDVGRAPSLQQGPKDTPPPPNPGTSRRSNTGGAAANSRAAANSGGGRDDNKDAAKKDSFDDPTGFNDAY